MFIAGYGDSINDTLEERTFSSAVEAKSWLQQVIKALVGKVGAGNYHAYSLACFSSFKEPEFIYRGPNNVTYFVREVRNG